MSRAHYMPQRQSDFVRWASQLNAKLLDEPERYSLSPDIAQALNADYLAFMAAYNASINTATRTKTAVELKNERKRSLVLRIRSVVGLIQNAWGMTNALRDELELPHRDVSPTPVPPPTAMPMIVVSAGWNGSIPFRIQDPTDSRRQRPADAFGTLVYWWVGEEKPVQLADWKLLGMTKRTENELTAPVTSPAGTKVWITALYINAKGEPGPACQPAVAYVPFGELRQAA